MEHLEFTLTTTYFNFWDQIYKQKFGTAMGSPIFQMVANYSQIEAPDGLKK